MKKVKVFGIGLGKTGTSTLKSCLEILGYKVHDGDISLVEPYIRHNMEPFYKLVDEYDAFEDEPWSLIYKEMDKKYPNSKFILTIRDDADSWIRSMLNFLFTSGIRGKANIMYYNRKCFGVSTPINNEQKFRDIYNNHIANVKDYFKDRPNDLLIINWKYDGWEKLCTFLNEPIPNVPLPHDKKGDYSLYERNKRIATKYPDKFYPEDLINYRNGGPKEWKRKLR